MDNNKKGLLTELNFELEAVRLGFTVLRPVSTERFDFVLKKKNKYFRIQVKTARAKKNCTNIYSVSVSSTANANQNKKTYSKEEIDYIATNIENDWILVDISKVVARSGISIATNSLRYKKYLRLSNLK